MDRSLDEILEERQVCQDQHWHIGSVLTCSRALVVDAAEDVAVLIATVAVDLDETSPNASATIPEMASKRSVYLENNKLYRQVLTLDMCRFSFLPRASVNRTTSIYMRRQNTNPKFDPLTSIEISHSPERMPETSTGSSCLRSRDCFCTILIHTIVTGSTTSSKTMTVSSMHHRIPDLILIQRQPAALLEVRATIATTENLQEKRVYHPTQPRRNPL
jgi:hypothetical protein